MIKCIYREDDWVPQTHCDKPADYIYVGKSYCATHMEIRGEELQREREEEERRMEALRKEIKD
jgi:hypothetical protein